MADSPEKRQDRGLQFQHGESYFSEKITRADAIKRLGHFMAGTVGLTMGLFG